jgi:RimJ/RimL family protein N-acetyltransferase
MTGPVVVLRPACADDADCLLEWRNHPQAAAQSRNAAPIERGVHVDWLRRMLESADCVFLIGQDDHGACGYVRFNHGGQGRWEVSIALAPGRGGQGLGGAMLNQGIALLRGDHPGAIVDAAVKPGNAPSEALFRRCGFIRHDQPGADGFLRFSLT